MKKQIIIASLLLASMSWMSCNNSEKTKETDINNTEVLANDTLNQQTAQNNQAETMPKTTVEVDNEMHDFGKIKEGTKVKHVFKLKNVGNQPFLIANATPSCGCTVPSFSKKPIVPGESAEIEIEFDSNGRKGKNTKTITVTSNAENAINLGFTAEVE